MNHGIFTSKSTSTNCNDKMFDSTNLKLHSQKRPNQRVSTSYISPPFTTGQIFKLGICEKWKEINKSSKMKAYRDQIHVCNPWRTQSLSHHTQIQGSTPVTRTRKPRTPFSTSSSFPLFSSLSIEVNIEMACIEGETSRIKGNAGAQRWNGNG